jgi:hypothetical protein
VKINFYWTPGHEEIELNETADQLAGEAASNQTGTMALQSSLGSFRRRTKELTDAKSFPFKPGSKQYKSKAKAISKGLEELKKGATAAIFQLRAGYSPLNEHLFKRKLTPSPLCSTCGIRENTNHFLLYCRRFSKARKAMRARMREEKIKINWTNASLLLDSPQVFPYLAEFILDTKRFVHFHSYLQTEHQGERPRSKERSRL